MVEKIGIDSVSDFLKSIEEARNKESARGNVADFIFRGQPTDKPLLPKLARPPLHADLENREKLMVDEFIRTCPGLSNLAPESNWEFLSLAQHHGLPTRLLDWTYGALGALWFAVETEPEDSGSEKDKDRSAVVWLLKTRTEDFITRAEEETLSPFDNRKTRIYRPRVIASRISAQGGLFTVHMFRKKQQNFLPLDNNDVYRERLIKFEIDRKRSCDLKKSLSGCGINRASLFPDLDGLCNHLAWRYFGK
jgi:FRG domain